MPETATHLHGIDITDNQLHPILNALNIGVLMTDAAGRITFYNDTHAQMDGLSHQDVLHRKVTDVYDLDENSSLVMRCLHTQRAIVDCPVIYRTQQGKAVDSIHNVFPLIRNSRTVGVVSFVKDYQYVADPVAEGEVKSSQQSFTGDTDFSFEDIKGTSADLLEAINRARLAAKTDSPVLIYGETGTGKELFAQSIHNLSARRAARYITVNCAAIPESLLESILFGTVKGAFTGALDKRGLFERASGGTLFLDEINAMSQAMQPKLLRAIQEKRVSRIGSHRQMKLDLKIISSINTTPEQALASDQVRRDLLYRLSVVFIALPPLRQRRDDLPLLIDHFIRKHNVRLGKNVRGVSAEVRRMFDLYDWPGNVRELENSIEGAMNLVGRNKLIEHWHLMSAFHQLKPAPAMTFDMAEPKPARDMPPASTEGVVWGGPFGAVQSKTADMPAVNRRYQRADLQRALADTDGNVADAARLLGISRQTLYRRLKACGMALPQKRHQWHRQMIIERLHKYDGNISQTAFSLGISRQLLSYRMKKLQITFSRRNA